MWVQFPLFQFLICIAKAHREYYSPSVELEMITSIPIPAICSETHSPSVELEMITSIPIPDL